MIPRRGVVNEPNNGANLDLLIESGGTIMHDIIIFAANTQMKDLFGNGSDSKNTIRGSEQQQ